MRKRTNKMLLLCVTLAMIAGTSGCVGDKTSSGEGLTPVRVILDWVPNTNHTGLYVAIEKGYYKAQGLDVTISQPPESTALTLLSNGNADFAVSAQETIAAALAADSPLPVLAVAAIINHNTTGIISLKENNIRTPKDMENHNYATWDIPIEQAMIRDVVAKSGGDYDKIEMIPSTVEDVVTALQTGIDTVWVYYAWEGIATQVKGLETNFFYFKDEDPALDFYAPVFASSEDYLNKNPETAKKFLLATAQGYEYAIERPDEAAEILCKAAPETDLELAKASQQYLAGQYIADAPSWGVIDPERWDRFYAWLYENGVIPKKLEVGQGFTNVYLPQ